MDLIPTADRALLTMFGQLMADDDTVTVAEDLRVLTEEFVLPGTPCTSGQLMAIVWKLQQAHPQHADHILAIAMGTGV